MDDYGIYLAAAIAVIGIWLALKIIKKLILAALIALLVVAAALFLAGVF